MPSSPDFSREPFVIEQYVTVARFENDGSGEEDLQVRVRIQSDAGAAAWNELAFGYDSNGEKVDVRYARVRKADGSTRRVAAEEIKESVAPAAREFQAYGNCKEKQVSVASLAPGDRLEYEVTKEILKPAAPGEFWLEHKFIDQAVVLDERLEINVPAARKLNLKSSASSPYQTTLASDRKIYVWKHADLKPHKAAQDDSQASLGELPEVQLTTFTSWTEMARWYAGLAQDRDQLTPEILAKTKELIEASSNDNEKVEALYRYVSKRIRYTVLPLGARGYQPRTAADVFSSLYGDAQDKHTLLAAMLHAAGIPAEPVLIPSARILDSSVPSPAQFDRVITTADIRDDVIWIDSTVDVAPYRMLAAGLRKKSALLISADAHARIVKTPSDPPFLSTQQVDIEGQVSELGKLTARVHYLLRGDEELVLRSAFHGSEGAQWKEIAQTMLAADGIHGEVTAVRPSDPTATRDPFEIEIDFEQSNFIDWARKSARTALPLLAIGLPDPPSDKTKPIDLGSPLDVTVKLKLTLPQSSIAIPPVSATLRQDFAEFKSSYQFTNHTLMAERSLAFKLRQLPPPRTAEYAAFTRAVTADENQALAIENTAPAGPTIPANATVDELLEAGLASFNSGNSQSAIPLFERAVQLDPQHKQAWNDLGLAYLRAGRLDQAVAALQSQIEANPSDEHANLYLGLAFERKQDYPQATAAFRRQTQINPLDPLAHGSLGDVLLEQHEYGAAVPEFEKAIVLSPQNAQLQIGLGRAYAETGKGDEAVAAFKKAASLSRSPEALNEVAFNLAEEKLDLDKAQRYTEIAIADETQKLRALDLTHVTEENVAATENLAAFWDTLGWVYFQKNDLDHATKYIRAAWLLSENGEAGDHLAQIYERLGQKDRAIHACALALAAPHAMADTRARLTLLLKGNAQVDELVAKAKPELEALRTIPVGKLLAGDAQADFFVLLSPGGIRARADAVKFISGSEELRPFVQRLRALDYGTVFPDSASAKLIRRGTLSCSKVGACALTLISPEDVRSPK
jgi:tetratricopeptide (TPR) repeat protein/transglutaminase-like putative cysteine protease